MTDTGSVAKALSLSSDWHAAEVSVSVLWSPQVSLFPYCTVLHCTSVVFLNKNIFTDWITQNLCVNLMLINSCFSQRAQFQLRSWLLWMSTQQLMKSTNTTSPVPHSCQKLLRSVLAHLNLIWLCKWLDTFCLDTFSLH